MRWFFWDVLVFLGCVGFYGMLCSFVTTLQDDSSNQCGDQKIARFRSHLREYRLGTHIGANNLQNPLNHFLQTSRYKICKLFAQCECLIYTRLGGCEIAQIFVRYYGSNMCSWEHASTKCVM
jgi:hypothetical protein